jgi:hypothetical protein
MSRDGGSLRLQSAPSAALSAVEGLGEIEGHGRALTDRVADGISRSGRRLTLIEGAPFKIELGDETADW